MDDHAKFERMLQMLLMLSSGIKYSTQELSIRFDTSERSVNRYISTFRKVGCIVECSQGKYSIPKITEPFKALNELLHFSEEEAFILSKAILSIDENSTMKSKLISKLYSLYDFSRVVDKVVKRSGSDSVYKLIKAIDEKKQVLLRQYRSSNGNIVRDRMVEPYDFATNYSYLWAFEPESQKCKLYRLSRIGAIEVLERDYQYETLHKKMVIDVFRISQPEQIMVKLRLSLRAYNLLLEEYPLSEKYLTPLDDNYWQFYAPVCGFDGVGRFVTGLCDQVDIEEPESFRTYIREKLKRSKFI